MRKIYFNLLMIVIVISTMTFISCDDEPEPDPFLAPTTETLKVALLEDFTGVRCGYCPDGHVKAKAIADANPGKFVILAVHAGSYAAPATGWANLTTPFGDELVKQAKVSGYPAGTISRIPAASLGVAAQISGGYAMSRSNWAQAAGVVMTQKAPVNIGAKATLDTATRLLTVKVDLYYTAEVIGSNNVNVALVQNKIICKQSGGTPDPNAYEQNHVLRHFITGQWGDVVSATGQPAASQVRKVYTYTVPDNYNGATIPPGGGKVVDYNLRVVVFVTNGSVNVLNAKEIDVE